MLRMKQIDQARIISDLCALGVQKGSILFVTANLGAVGFFKNNLTETSRAWLDILRESVGQSGTVIVAGYTPTFLRFKKDSTIIFDRHTPPTSGPLSKAFCQDPSVIRSKHPTCSYLGFGPHAAKILSGHDDTSSSYSVVGKIIELGGTNLMLGTIDKKNAPMAFHYAQEELGHTKQHPLCGLFQSYYRVGENKIKLFTRSDCGGCSSGAYHLYGALTVEGAINYGFVGNAQSGLIDGAKSFQIIKGAIARNRQLTMCDDLSCISCRGQWRSTGLNASSVYVKKLWKIVIKNKSKKS
jgi:aminoglycoside 3-N-acetyltransferase